MFSMLFPTPQSTNCSLGDGARVCAGREGSIAGESQRLGKQKFQSRRRFANLWRLTLSVALAWPIQANAEDEVIVTSRKRIETAQDVPQSVSVFTRQQLEEREIRSLVDLSAFTPGFFFRPVGSFEGRMASDLRFRGMDINTSTPWLQLGSTFIDGVYVSGGVQNISFDAVERVEVVRGPQSALFGRSTFGGAVNVVTADPGESLSGRLGVMAGEDEEKGFRGWIEAPLIPEKLTSRISATWREFGGHYTDLDDGSPLGAQESYAVTALLLAKPTTDFSAKLRMSYANDNDSLAALSLVRNDAVNCGPFFSGGIRTFCGELEAPPGNVDADLTAFLANIEQTTTGLRMDDSGLERYSARASLVLTLDSDGWILTSVSGASDEQVGLGRDVDVVPGFNLVNAWQGISTRDFQQEFRFASKAESHSWMLGANYYDYRYAADAIAPPLAPLQKDRAQIDTTGLFGSLGFHPSGRSELMLEARWQRDHIDQGAALKAEFSTFLPRVTFSHRVTPATTMYISAAEGNKPGAFNANVAARPVSEREILEAEYGIQIPVGEEKLTSFELGTKHDLSNGRGRGSIALYYMDWLDQQTRRSLSDPRIANGAPFNGFINAGRSELYGVELEGTARLFEQWEISASYAYTHSEYRDFSSTLHQQVLGKLSASGASLPNNPEHAGVLSSQFHWRAGSSTQWFARADLLYEGSKFTDEVNLTEYGERWRVNAQLGFRHRNTQWTLFVRNLTDDDALPSARQVLDFQQGGLGWEVLLPERRTIGLRVDYSRGTK